MYGALLNDVLRKGRYGGCALPARPHLTYDPSRTYRESAPPAGVLAFGSSELSSIPPTGITATRSPCRGSARLAACPGALIGIVLALATVPHPVAADAPARFEQALAQWLPTCAERGAALRSLYAARRGAALWQGRDGARWLAIVRATLVEAASHGLDPADYEPAPTGAASELKWSDIVLRYAHDVRVGRIDPPKLYPDWALAPLAWQSAPALARARGGASRGLPC